MKKIKKIKQVFKSIPTIEGAGVHLKRAFGFHQVPHFDPFLLLDDFHSDKPDQYLAGFPWHPHRGIETITYVLEGDVVQGDSIGNKGFIRPGDVQWMTAGSGIIHQEMPKGDKKGRLWGSQLWANLPASHKMMEPRYREVLSTHIPEVKLASGVRVKIICGEIAGVKGPVQDIITQPRYLDVTVDADRETQLPIADDHTVFAYVIQGSAYFDQEHDAYTYTIAGVNYFDFKNSGTMKAGSCILFAEGDTISVKTEDEVVRFLFISGKPSLKPVAWYGPIVMNTQEELKTAFKEFEEGTFIKGR